MEPAENTMRVIDALMRDLKRLRVETNRLYLSAWADDRSRAEYADNTRAFAETYINTIAEHSGDMLVQLLEGSGQGNSESLGRTADQALRDVFADEFTGALPDGDTVMEDA